MAPPPLHQQQQQQQQKESPLPPQKQPPLLPQPFKLQSAIMSSGIHSCIPVRMPCSVPGKAAYVVWKTEFLVDDRYQLLRALGRGAYGVVVSARDSLTGQKVAIKKIASVFDNHIVAWRTLREVRCWHGILPDLRSY